MNISNLIGETIISISPTTEGDVSILFDMQDGKKYLMNHDQDCCERVSVRSIEGDLQDLIGSPILLAQESTNRVDSTGIEWPESFTWTFYKFATIKGYVTITWLGESNGYYSEDVSFEQTVSE